MADITGSQFQQWNVSGVCFIPRLALIPTGHHVIRDSRLPVIPRTAAWPSLHPSPPHYAVINPLNAKILGLTLWPLCDQLRRSLAAIGYISQGSVLDRSTLRSPRYGCQWTRKVAGKTITVASNREQFDALGQAVKNHRQLRQTLGKMEALSRRILFATLPDTHRRKRLSRKVLGLN